MLWGQHKLLTAMSMYRNEEKKTMVTTNFNHFIIIII